jgi:hypothetical protein
MNNNAFYNRLWEESPMGRMGCGSPIVVTIIITLILVFSSCATKTKIEYVDREVVKYETKIQHDTLINNIHDSIYHTVFQKGDTIYDTKYIEKTKWRDRVVVKTDTCYRDSVQTITINKTIEKRIIPKWCYYCLVVCVIFIIFAIRKLIQWLQTI